MDLDREALISFRDQLRNARASALLNNESFQELLFVVERFGFLLTKNPNATGLNSYKDAVETFAVNHSPLAGDIMRAWHTSFRDLYTLVNRARNDALHQGAFARNLTKQAVQLALILEDALMESLLTVNDYMVRNPICAYHWQPISFVRQQLLENSFSYLPVFINDGWNLISDHSVALYLRSGTVSQKERKKRLLQTVEEAVNSHENKLFIQRIDDDKLCDEDTTVEQSLSKLQEHQYPLLVIRKKEQTTLLGILTAFDLL